MYDKLVTNQRCHLTMKKRRSTWMTSRLKDYPTIRRKGKPTGQTGKAMTAGRPDKARPNAAAVEPTEKECKSTLNKT